jgi:hypothetical protein
MDLVHRSSVRWKCLYQVRAIAVFPVFRLFTYFVSLLTYEFWLSLWKIARCSLILLLPLWAVSSWYQFWFLFGKSGICTFVTIACHAYSGHFILPYNIRNRPTYLNGLGIYMQSIYSWHKKENQVFHETSDNSENTWYFFRKRNFWS